MKVRNIKTVTARFQRLSKQAELQVKSSVVRNTDQIFAEALNEVPIRDGYLRGSGNTSFQDNQLTGIVAFGGNAAPYAPYVEFGTGKNKVIPVGFEKFAYQYYVNGEGTMQPQPYLIPAFIKYRKVFLSEMKKIAKNISK
jgi:HK97 gp10 family phage protein